MTAQREYQPLWPHVEAELDKRQPSGWCGAHLSKDGWLDGYHSPLREDRVPSFSVLPDTPTSPGAFKDFGGEAGSMAELARLLDIDPRISGSQPGLARRTPAPRSMAAPAPEPQPTPVEPWVIDLAAAAHDAYQHSDSAEAQAARAYVVERGLSSLVERARFGVVDAGVIARVDVPRRNKWRGRLIIPTLRGDDVVWIKARYVGPLSTDELKSKRIRKYDGPEGSGIPLYNAAAALPHVARHGFIYVVEGELDAVATLAGMGDKTYPVIGLPGGTLSLDWARRLAGAGFPVIVAMDADKAGGSHAKKAERELRTAGALTVTVAPPAGHLDHNAALVAMGRADFAAAIGATVAAALASLAEVPEVPTRGKAARGKGPAVDMDALLGGGVPIPGSPDYFIDDRFIFQIRMRDGNAQRVGIDWRPYVRGWTYIEGGENGKRVTFDMGVSADFSDARPVPASTVKDATCWEHFPQCVGFAPRPWRDALFNAVLYLASQVPRTVGYDAIGVHVIDGLHTFVSGGVSINADGPVEGLAVQLPGVLGRFKLPAPPRDSDAARDAIRAAVDLLRVAPLSVTAPLVGAVWLAPLSTALGEEAPDFTLWFHGPSGVFKSELSALAQAHYGPFTADSLPASFADTGPGQEKVLYGAKDAYVAVDDYHPASDPAEAHAMSRTAQRLLRARGNGTGRNLSTREGELRESKPPRCVPVATGELLPDGQSALARAFAVPVEPGAVDVGRLTESQRHTSSYALAMAAYIQTIMARMDDTGPDGLCATLPTHYRDLRLCYQQQGGHARGPGQVAHLFLGLEQFLTFAHAAGAIDDVSCADLLTAAWAALASLAADMAAELSGASPVERFMALLVDGFSSKRAYLTGDDGGPPDDALFWGWEPDPLTAGGYRHGSGTRLGVVTDEWMLLFPEETYRYVVAAARAAGEVFPVKLQTLTKRLAEAGLIQTEDAAGRQRTVKEIIDGKRRRVIKLSRTGRAGPASDTANDADSSSDGSEGVTL